MLRHLALVVLAFSPVAAYSAESPSPAFDMPFWSKGGENSCRAGSISATLSPDGSALSVLPGGTFLDTTRKSTRRAFCSFEVRLRAAVAAKQNVRVELRGADIKTAWSEIRYEIRVGAQRHRIEFGRGRVTDAAANAKLFYVELAPGARSFKVQMEGAATASSGNQATVSIDSLDFSFLGRDVVAEPAPAPSPAGSAPAAQSRPGSSAR